MKKALVLTILVLLLCACNSNKTSEIKQVTCNEKDKIIKNDAHTMLIDVRTKEEYDEKHIEKAINIPYDEIVDKLSAYGTIDFNTPIIVYCQSGKRSNMAAESLIKEGYKKIYDLGSIENCN